MESTNKRLSIPEIAQLAIDEEKRAREIVKCFQFNDKLLCVVGWLITEFLVDREFVLKSAITKYIHFFRRDNYRRVTPFFNRALDILMHKKYLKQVRRGVYKFIK